ncbi:hypothetical protein VTI74DRAFT_4966 [Chaetomium olivicolor]
MLDGRLWQSVVFLAALVALAAAKPQYPGGYGPYPTNPNSESDPSSGSGSSSASDSSPFFGSGSSGPRYQGGFDFDIEKAEMVRGVHGLIASFALVIFFPLGSILLRVLPQRWKVGMHVLMQAMGALLLCIAVALGIYLVVVVKLPIGNGNLLSNPDMNYHPIIGLVVSGTLLLLQPIFGFIHHRLFKKVPVRQAWSYMHLFNGRLVITLGIINGGLGLWMAGASRGHKIAYIALSSILWSAWMGFAIWHEMLRCCQKRSRGRMFVNANGGAAPYTSF